MDIILQHLVMQVDASSLTCVADEADQLSAFYLLSLAHRSLLQVGITGLITIAVIDSDHVAVAPMAFLNVKDDAISSSVRLCALLRREVDTAMELLNHIDRVRAITKIRGDVLDFRFLQRENGGDVS